MAESTSHNEIMTLTTEIVAAHVANNSVAVADLPDLIQQVFRSLTNAGDGVGAEPPRPQPAVSIRRSVRPDYIVCLEDGKKLKMLKRHLRTAFNMTPAEYRERWDLPPDYPMVAPNYAEKRSKLAKQIGFGTRPRKRKRKRK